MILVCKTNITSYPEANKLLPPIGVNINEGYSAPELIPGIIYTVLLSDVDYYGLEYYKIISPLDGIDKHTEYVACYFYTEDESKQIIRDINIDNITKL
jgi:hypothetical protein